TFLSIPTTLSAQLTPRVVSLLFPAFTAFVIVGVIAGAIAAWRTVRLDPGAITRGSSTRRGLRKQLQTKFIDWETVVPALATLAVFMCFLFVLFGVIGSIGPLAGAGQQTITEPGTPNPVASDVPVAYADAFRTQEITASPEIILFEVVNGEPVLARGVNFTAYREFTEMSIQDGRLAQTPNEAVIGGDLAQSSEISVGETILIGGSTTPAFTRVKITGRYTATGIEDDQLLVSLPTARTLGGVRSDAVNIIRTRELTVSSNQSTIVVTGAQAARKNGELGVQLSVRNPGLQSDTRVLQVTIGEQSRTVSVSVDAQQSSEVFIKTTQIEQSDQRIRVGDFESTVGLTTGGGGGNNGGNTGSSDISLSIPSVVPANSTPQVRLTRGGTAVENAQIRYRNTTRQTNAEGRTRLPFDTPGAVTLTIVTAESQFERTVNVRRGIDRPLDMSLVIDPSQPSIFTKPTVEVSVNNRWNTVREEQIQINGPERQQTQSVQLSPGESTVRTFSLAQRPAGRYTVEAMTTGTGGERVNETYSVQGDERLGAALAQSGRYTAGGGITQGIQVVFSNIEVLIGAIIILLMVMTLGSSTAAFTRSVQTTRRKIGIHRATGADPYTILLNIARDAALIGVVASVGALGVAMLLIEILLSTGALRAFGIVLRPQYSGLSVSVALIGGTGLAIVSAVLAASTIVWSQPSRLFNDRVNTPEGEQ
uniref:ABC transporter permease n=1 Tax=Haloquadratum walsbyi TaxID=293091 RepID=UPI0023F14520